MTSKNYKNYKSFLKAYHTVKNEWGNKVKKNVCSICNDFAHISKGEEIEIDESNIIMETDLCKKHFDEIVNKMRNDLK